MVSEIYTFKFDYYIFVILICTGNKWQLNKMYFEGDHMKRHWLTQKYVNFVHSKQIKAPEVQLYSIKHNRLLTSAPELVKVTYNFNTKILEN